MSTFLQQVINGISIGSVYALIAVGYSLVYSILKFSWVSSTSVSLTARSGYATPRCCI
jgi:branched-subunit amino acid ABC-type transport system permease component